MLASIGAIGIIGLAIFFFANLPPQAGNNIESERGGDISSNIPAAEIPLGAVSAAATDTRATSTPVPPLAPITPVRATTSSAQVKQTAQASVASSTKVNTSGSAQVQRILNPYPDPPKGFLEVNTDARASLVNILCTTRGGSLQPVSGSGIIIHPQGIILTNAHVAQFVLLASHPRVNLSCTIRTGSPARSLWRPEVLYIPPVWIKKHAADITEERPVGTGEYDYALLRITSSLDGTALPSTFSFLLPDTRDAIGFLDDLVLVASYPAEFLGGIAAQSDLHPVSSITTIRDLLTFQKNTVDVVSVGGVIGAQSGSSGGAVVNAWGRLIGIISTTSEGETTSDRDLRAITLSYIDRDIKAQSGLNIEGILTGNHAALAANFNTEAASDLILLLIEAIEKR